MEVYVLQDGERRGPFPVFRLQEMLDEQEIGPDVPVWHAGMNEWRRLADEPSLNTALRLVRPAAEPPPLPEDHASSAAGEAGRRLLRRIEASATEQTAAVLKARRAVAWRRFVARIIDLHMARAALVGGLALADAHRAWDLMFPALTVVFVAPLAWVVGEAVCLKLAGTTPGRAMLGLRVRDRDGACLTFRAALKRSILVWAAGSGLGLPMQFLLPPAQWAMGFHQYQTQGETIWDRTAGSRVEHRVIPPFGIVALVFSIVAWLGASMWLFMAAPLPDAMEPRQREFIEQRRALMRQSLQPPPAPDNPAPSPDVPPAARAAEPQQAEAHDR